MTPAAVPATKTAQGLARADEPGYFGWKRNQISAADNGIDHQRGQAPSSNGAHQAGSFSCGQACLYHRDTAVSHQLSVVSPENQILLLANNVVPTRMSRFRQFWRDRLLCFIRTLCFSPRITPESICYEDFPGNSRDCPGSVQSICPAVSVLIPGALSHLYPGVFVDSQSHCVFVTGGTGYVGRPLIDLLLKPWPCRPRFGAARLGEKASRRMSGSFRQCARWRLLRRTDHACRHFRSTGRSFASQSVEGGRIPQCRSGFRPGRN